MRLLVLGGTSFVGRHAVEQALAAGHEVTVLHRGPGARGGGAACTAVPAAEHVHADRDGGLALVGGRRFDALLDTSGYVPRVVRQAAETLAPEVERAVFVSTVSVYDGAHVVDADRTGAEEVTAETYGPLKVACEQDFAEVFRDRGAIVRPTYVAGPWDPTGRFTYWVERAARPAPFVVPGPPDAPFQVIDVRDLAGLLLQLLASPPPDVPGADAVGETPAFDAVGPAGATTWRDLVPALLAGTGEAGTPVWVDRERLAELGVDLDDLPLVEDPAAWPVLRRDPAPAVAAGLRLRPLVETVAATLEWRRGAGADLATPGYLDPAVEAEAVRRSDA